MFTLTQKWSVFLGETVGAFVNRLRKRTPGVKPTNDYTDAQMTQATDVVRQLSTCQPMNEHELDSKLIRSISNKIKRGHELEA